MGGVIPFAVIFVDLDELLQTMWQNDLYLSISYASMACLTYAISVSAITVALIFFQLCSEVTCTKRNQVGMGFFLNKNAKPDIGLSLVVDVFWHWRFFVALHLHVSVRNDDKRAQIIDNEDGAL